MRESENTTPETDRRTPDTPPDTPPDIRMATAGIVPTGTEPTGTTPAGMLSDGTQLTRRQLLGTATAAATGALLAACSSGAAGVDGASGTAPQSSGLPDSTTAATNSSTAPTTTPATTVPGTTATTAPVSVPTYRPSPSRYLSGNFAPVTEEITAENLEVVGAIPAELEGRWLRNGPNPDTDVDPTNYQWFLGQGMVHGVRLRGGKAEWYRNRYTLPADRRAAGEFGANTSVGGFADTTWALVEAGPAPLELSYELEPQGENRFFGTLESAYAAHPKYDPATGELHAITYRWPDDLDHANYVIIGPDGRVSSVVPVPVSGMPMIHDMALTENYAVVLDLSVAVDIDMALGGSPFPFRWSDDRPSWVGLVPRAGGDVIWCEVDQSFVFHTANAFERDGKVEIDVIRYDRVLASDANGPAGDSLPILNHWVVDPVTRKVSTETVNDQAQEFPRINPRMSMQPYRWAYAAEVIDDKDSFGGLIKTDVTSGEMTRHDFGPYRQAAEPVFVPSESGRDEDEGWIMSVVYDATTDKSELCILDAADIAAPEVARIQIPQRVPFGFHGNWVPDAVVGPDA